MTTVQIPEEIVRELMELTGHDTPEEAVLFALEWWLETQRDGNYLQARAVRGSWEAFDAALALVPDTEPAPEDRLPY
ncbi:hypothetical protein [Deinococcus frigens]|uniref:hypothetical protein n=1 Tax=Deinococcus frigens TaxID=249403 RepID=UPI000554EDFA|nr:hypothetical protein [Deinococcus frigens]